jgi:8-oxo-dGTP pyrophosphatase MutT (NUDIX family)
MPPAEPSARSELSAFAADPAQAHATTAWKTLGAFPVPTDARAAAVLILFGVLDDAPARHAAADAAVSRDLDVLLLARAATLRSHPGQIAFPGGRVDDADRDSAATALREAEEETGLDPSGIDILGELPTVPLAYSSHLVTPIIGWWRRSSPVRVVDEAESADVFRLPVADLLAPENRGQIVARRDGREWRSPGFVLHRDERRLVVWGFTAMLLDGLFDGLGWTEPWDRDRLIDHL